MYSHNLPIDANKKGVYYIRVEQSYYIGMTTRSFAERWHEHITDLRNNTHSNYKLQEAYASGLDMACGVLVYLTSNDIIARAETCLIEYYQQKVPILNIRKRETQHETLCETEKLEETRVSALQCEVSRFAFRVDSVCETFLPAYTDIRKEISSLRNAGKSKKEIIKIVWGVSPGSSKRYKEAAQLYDSLCDGTIET